jgi:hypothetical protein
MAVAGIMSQDDDIEKLLSWLQMPDLVYRDFAGGRDVSDVPGPSQGRREYEGDVGAIGEEVAPAPVAEERPAAPSEPDATVRRPRRPAMIAPEPPASPGEAEPQGDRPLNQVFDRLGPSESRLPDPRNRLRNIPPLGPPRGRSR